jgi:hypothetical protein
MQTAFSKLDTGKLVTSNQRMPCRWAVFLSQNHLQLQWLESRLFQARLGQLNRYAHACLSCWHIFLPSQFQRVLTSHWLLSHRIPQVACRLDPAIMRRTNQYMAAFATGQCKRVKNVCLTISIGQPAFEWRSVAKAQPILFRVNQVMSVFLTPHHSSNSVTSEVAGMGCSRGDILVSPAAN